ncbi:hypothetical protein FPQ18DRAFT_306333 [Pyronema domesticum]|uniref:Uncharacterized protein n=1 Tax=Pyronema omphalodes (strain CBS 100304) TaxID=1076935 RepID=U4LJQ9_PYROM|nr:hypothetical protein FPQ18DRAFT_306333 [Pyronema domesticum]CCX32193.1 Protein of unknown function [Pyronema omphalodes CBS 100304]
MSSTTSMDNTITTALTAINSASTSLSLSLTQFIDPFAESWQLIGHDTLQNFYQDSISLSHKYSPWTLYNTTAQRHPLYSKLLSELKTLDKVTDTYIGISKNLGKLGKEVYELDKKSKKAAKKMREMLKKVMKEEKKIRKKQEKRDAKTIQKGKAREITGEPGGAVDSMQQPAFPKFDTLFCQRGDCQELLDRITVLLQDPKNECRRYYKVEMIPKTFERYQDDMREKSYYKGWQFPEVLRNARKRLEGVLEEFDGVMKEVSLKNPFEDGRYEVQEQEMAAEEGDEDEGVNGEERGDNGEEDRGIEDEENPFRDGAEVNW